ncbi:hypothetical protein ACWC09_50950 [Streptomyces sp. NPDC001617]
MPVPRWPVATYSCSTSSPTTVTNPAMAPPATATTVSATRSATRLANDTGADGDQLVGYVAQVAVAPSGAPDIGNGRCVGGG